jgi:hypothetical protein
MDSAEKTEMERSYLQLPGVASNGSCLASRALGREGGRLGEATLPAPLQAQATTLERLRKQRLSTI